MITYLEDILSEIFSGTPQRMRQRRLFFLVGALGSWLLLAILAHPPDRFGGMFVRRLQVLVVEMGQIPFNRGAIQDTLVNLLIIGAVLVFVGLEIIRGMFAPDVLRHVLAVIAPMFVAFRIAVIYLDDIFELNDEGVAFRYIRQAAFGIRPYRLVVENGDVSPSHRNSPLLHIGGPGLVQVNLENAAVFNRIDGTPHIIGPTGRGSVPLQPFERLQDVVDLRDQITRANELVVEGRTRDGIRIRVMDVRMMYSILRSRSYAPGQASRQPYSYREDAIMNVVYNRSDPHWTKIMPNLIRTQLQLFISQHSLGEILAAIGMPEIEESRQAASQFFRPNGELFTDEETEGTTPASSAVDTDQMPDFVPRLEITDLFHDTALGFPVRAMQRGVQLQWIDVGTWNMPSTVIPEMQVEAWRMTLDNAQRRQELEKLENESRLDELLRLIREVPLISFNQGVSAEKEDEELIADIIADYLGHLRSAQDEFTSLDKAVPEKLENAIRVLSRYRQDYLQRTGRARYLE